MNLGSKHKRPETLMAPDSSWEATRNYPFLVAQGVRTHATVGLLGEHDA